MPNADVAWVDVLPSARNFLPTLQRQTGAAAKTAGTSAGRQFGTAFGGSSVASVEKASRDMSVALRKTADAAGQVRVAELKLKELRESGKATASQVAAQEERLATARRRETTANADLSTSTRRVRDAQDQHTAAVGRGSRAMDDGTRRAGLLTRAFGGVRGAVTAGFAAFYGAQVAVRFIGSAITAASDLGEQTNKVKVVFGQSATAVINFSKTTDTALGISQRSALTSVGIFGNLFRAIGITEKSSGSMSIQLIKTAADLASFNNASPEEVLEAMRAGLVGETEPLRRFGINISDAAMRAELLAQGIKLQSGPLTATQKAQAAYALILKQTTLAQGDFARTSDGLANQQRILSAEWDNAKAKLGGLLVGPATAFTHWLTDAIPKVQTFGQWISKNSSWLLPLGAAIGGIAIAVKAWSIAQGILNAVLYANPIVLVIAAIAGLAAGLVVAYSKSETFRAIVQTAFRTVGDAGLWLWNNALKPTFSALQTAWIATSQWVMRAWVTYIQPAWAAVVAVAQKMWRDLQPVFRFIGSVWADILSGMKAAWDTVLHPMWNALQVVLVTLFNKVVKPYFGFIWAAWGVMAKVMVDVWNNVLHPMWNLLVAVLKGMWTIVIGPIFKSIELAWKVLVVAMQLAWNLILKPMWAILSVTLKALWSGVLSPIFTLIGKLWGGMATGMRSVYDRVLHPMWGILKAAIQGVQGVFEGAVKGIKTVWDGLRKIAAAPINFIVRTVLRDGLFTAWNWVLDKLGISSWHVDTKSKWLQGIPGYATGGQIPGKSPTARADNIPIWATAGEYMVQQPIAQQTTPYLEALNSGNRQALHLAQEWGRYASGGQIFEFTRAHFPRAKLNSAYRPGDPGYHGSNQAADMGEAGFSGGAGRKYIADMKSWWYDNFGRKTEEIIYTGLYNARPNVKNGANHGYSAAINAAHTNHLHVAETGPLGGAVGGPSGGGGSVDLPWWKALWNSTAGAYSWLKSKISAVGQMAGKFGNSPFVGWLSEMPGKLLGGAWDKIKGTIGGLISDFVHVGQDVAPGDTGATKAAVKGTAALPSYGWGSTAQWNAIDWIINHESSWDPRAQNPSSSASGLFQHIDSTWRAYRPIGVTAAHMKDARVSEQAQAGLNYIKSRYGSPTSAQAFWQAHHWYGRGGPVFHAGGHTRGWPGDALALMGPDERVLSAPQDDYFRRFVDAVSEGGGVAVGRTAPLIGSVIQAPGESSDAFVQRIYHKLRVADRGGVHSDSVLGS